MSKRRFSNGMMSLGITAIVGLALFMMLATDAAAQRGGGGPRLTPEKAEAAWTLQAEGVAGDLNLKKKQVTSLVEAYVAARKSQQEAMTALRSEGGGGGGGGGR